MSTSIQALNLTVRSENCLLEIGLNTVESLIDCFAIGGFNGLLKIPNLGRVQSLEVAERLIAWLSFANRRTPKAAQQKTNNEALRDDFAAKAMQELIHSARATSADEGALDAAIKKMAGRAYQVADAMLRARGAT